MMKKKMVVALGAALISAALVAGLTGCGSGPEKTQVAAPAARTGVVEQYTLKRSIPDPRPTWVDSPRSESSATILAFSSAGPQYAASVQEARTGQNGAQRDGQQQLIDYYGTLMASQGREYSANFGLSSEVFDPQSVGQEMREFISQNVAQALEAQEYYTEEYLDNKTGRTVYTVYALMTIERARVAKLIDDFGKQQAADYQAKAAAEQDEIKKQQLERAAEFWGGNLSSRINN
jgi:hypothetical protein